MIEERDAGSEWPNGHRLKSKENDESITVYEVVLTLEERDLSVLYKDSVRTAQ
jgi:hypothetical protein